MALYRWASVVLTGPWRPSREEAMQDALASGQAKLVGDDLTLRSFARIEQLHKDSETVFEANLGSELAGSSRRSGTNGPIGIGRLVKQKPVEKLD